MYLLHLSGGGSLLVVSAWHGLVDFKGLQTFVSHIAAAYNTALARRGDGSRADTATSGSSNSAASVDGNRQLAGGAAAAHSAATSSAARPGLPSQLSEHQRGFFAPEAVDSIAESLSLPVGAKLRESVLAIPIWRVPFMTMNILYQLLVRGGGVEVSRRGARFACYLDVKGGGCGAARAHGNLLYGLQRGHHTGSSGDHHPGLSQGLYGTDLRHMTRKHS